MLRFLLAAGLLAQLCAAQQSGWHAGQVNATMCYWDSPRAAVVRDTLYIDGGALWWRPGMSDGSFGDPTSDDNPLGIVYQLNFSTIFNTTAQTNISNVFTTQSKAAANGAANNVAPNYYDGVMIANDFEWFIYGGLITDTAEYTLPDSQAAAAYEVYASGPPKTFHAGYSLETLPSSVNRYVTNGAGVSIPSENLGYYFGGLRSASFGPIYYLTGNETDNADVLSTTMIELDLAVQNSETWNNFTLPTTVPGRINAELVWVPVSKRGVLVAIGGVVDAEFAELDTSLNASQTAETNLKSPLLMSTVSVYDIENRTWYQQPTSETAPPMLTQGCTVMASAQDGSSHNIYWYGGWDGIDQTQPFSDDVWVLSIPTFKWIKVSSGTTGHARAGHRCVKPYPDQMFVVGGYASLAGTIPQCLSGNIIQIFNLSSATWITDYNPAVWSNYSVPSAIVSIIGGTGTGSATQTTPSPSGFSNANLTSVFGSAYNTSKITNWYPYQAATATSPPTNTTTTITPVPKPGSGTPSYLGPVLGVVLGLFFLTLLIVAFLIWRRRYLFRSSARGGQSENGTLDNRRWVTNWLRATPVDAKAPTVTTDETPSSPYDAEERHETAEVQGQQVYEMMDTSRLVELGSHPTDTGTGLHPIPIPAPIPSPHTQARGLAHSASVTSATSNATSFSQYSEVRPSVSPVMWEGREGVVSGMSQISDGDRGHLRGISETSVSTVGGSPLASEGRGNIVHNAGVSPANSPGLDPRNKELGTASEAVPPAVPDPPTRSTAVSPPAPSHRARTEGSDYLTAKDVLKEEEEEEKKSPVNPKRRSNFSEELGER